MTPPPPKEALRDELLGLLLADLEALQRAQRSTQEGATHEEAKPENDKDTRALEQSYLARGQAARVEAMREAVAAVRAMPLRPFGPEQPVALGALVSAEEEDETFEFWLAPEGGGCRLAAGRVQVVTPRSPLGRALLGKHEGEECDVLLAGRTRSLLLTAVRLTKSPRRGQGMSERGVVRFGS